MAEITYLMGTDTFYRNAKGFFATHGTVVDAPTGGQTLEGVFNDLRTRAAAGGVFDTINLVSHASALSSVMFGLRAADKGSITTQDDLTNALAAAGSTTPWFAPPGAPAVSAKTHVRLYGCDIGRDKRFLKDLGLLFGTPADMSAPLRVAIFGHTGANYWHRLARTWSVTWPDNIAKALPVKDATATAFVTKAMAKFGPEALLRSTDPIPDDRPTQQMIEAAVQAAKGSQDGFWLHEWSEVAIPAANAADPQAYIDTVRPARSAVLQPSLPVDDTNVALAVGPADFTDKTDPKLWKAHIAMVGHKIDVAVNVNDASMFNTVAIAPASAPSPGPKPVPTGGSAAAALTPAPGLWDLAADGFLEAGGTQTELDDLLAGLGGDAVGELVPPDFVAPPAGPDAHAEGEVPA